MREPFTQLYLHLVWSTWDREPFLTDELTPAVYGCIVQECKLLNVEVVALGGTPNHVHLLVRFPTTVSVADLVKRVKGASSHLVTHQVVLNHPFKWQEGYGAFTVSKSNVPAVADYIRNQKRHHQESSLIEEYEIG